MTTPRTSARVIVPAAVGLATLVGFGAGALFQPGSAGAQTDDTTSTTTKANEDGATTAKPADCVGKEPLDDATAEKVKAAALKAVSGATVDRVGPAKRTDGYVAMLTKADGTTRVLVHEDKDFKVTKVEDPAPVRGPGGHGGPGDKAPLDEATAAKVKAAALKEVPGATVNKTHHDRADGYVALLTKADGTTRVLVHLDKDFKVTSVDDPAPVRTRRPGGHGGPGGMRGSEVAPEASATSA